MKNKELANCTNTPIAEVMSIGAAYQKMKISNGLPERIKNYFEQRKYWIHDMEYYYSAYNCIGIAPSDIIAERAGMGFSYVCRSLFRATVELTNQQSGGIGFIDFDSDMSKYINDESDDEITEALYELIEDLNMYIRKGCEMAYVTFNFGLCTNENGRRISKALLRAFSRKQFVFPNLVFKLRNGVNHLPGDTNYDIYCLASEVTSRCMNPTYLNMDASYNKDVPPEEFGVMGCRTRIVANRFHSTSSLKRGNIAAVTVNLVQLAIIAESSAERFEELIEQTMDVAREQLLHRYNALCKTGHFDYIKQHSLYVDSVCETNKMLRNGTLSIGFIGLWDAISVLYNVDISDKNTIKKYFDYALRVISIMRTITDCFSEQEDLNFSLLASSAEGVSGSFVKYDSVHYKNVANVFDKGFYGNSFHIPVNCEIDYLEKISLEAPFHKLCNGGHISYVELSEIPFGNSDAIRELVDYACDNDIGYFGINFPLDVCRSCGERGMFVNNCVHCGGEDIRRLRRVSGYLSEIENFTSGKYSELLNRKSHIRISNMK